MGTALQTIDNNHVLAMRPELDVEYTTRQLLARVAVVAQVKDKLMKADVHYGRPPGVNKKSKPVLLKPGAEILLMALNIAPSYIYEDLSTPDSIRYRFRAIGTSHTGVFLGEGIGEASTDEEKYRWRKCGKKEWEAADESRRRLKWKQDWDTKREVAEFQVRSAFHDIANTILKMASKRALVHLAISVSACSDMFDQDLEDISEDLRQMGYDEAQGSQGSQEPEPQPKAAAAPQSAPPASEGGQTTYFKPDAFTGEPEPKITDTKRQELLTIMAKAQPIDMTEADWKKSCRGDMKTMYKVDSSGELTMAQADDFITKLAGLVNLV